ncbi:hypothetical protein BDF19DRAFT_454824, partial [Syncephalis fuscata]
MDELISIFFPSNASLPAPIPAPLPPPPPKSVLERLLEKLPWSVEQLRWFTCIVLSTAGVSATVFGYVRYGRRARRLRNTPSVNSLHNIQDVLQKTPHDSSVWLKITGRVHCPNPVVAPLCGLPCAYVDVIYARRHLHRRKLSPQATNEDRRRLERREKRRWSPKQLNELFHEKLKSAWTLQIPSGEHVNVDMAGADLSLERTVNRKKIHESVLRNDAAVLVLGRVNGNLNGDVFCISNQRDQTIRRKARQSTSNTDWCLITTQTEKQLLYSLDKRWISWTVTGVGFLSGAAFLARIILA